MWAGPAFGRFQKGQSASVISGASQWMQVASWSCQVSMVRIVWPWAVSALLCCVASRSVTIVPLLSWVISVFLDLSVIADGNREGRAS